MGILKCPNVKNVKQYIVPTLYLEYDVNSKHLKGRSGAHVSGTRFSLGRSFGTPCQWDTFFPRKVVRDPASVGHVFPSEGRSGPRVSGTHFSLGRSFRSPRQWDMFFPRKVVRDPASVGDVFPSETKIS